MSIFSVFRVADWVFVIHFFLRFCMKNTFAVIQNETVSVELYLCTNMILFHLCVNSAFPPILGFPVFIWRRQKRIYTSGIYSLTWKIDLIIRHSNAYETMLLTKERKMFHKRLYIRIIRRISPGFGLAKYYKQYMMNLYNGK